MFNYREPKHPGPWIAFTQRKDVKDLPLMEQRQVYLKEQLFFEDFAAQQAYALQNYQTINANQHSAGAVLGNVVDAVRFVGSFTALTANDTFIDVEFAKSVEVTGAPRIVAVNGQQGGGSVAAVTYSFLEILGEENDIVRFRHQHGNFPNGNGGVRAGVIDVGDNLVGSAAFTGTAGASGAVSGVTFTTATGTGGSAGPATSVFDVIIAGGLSALSEISFVSSASNAPYTPGNTLSADAAALTTAGASDAGDLDTVITLVAGDLTGDILTLTGTSIDLNGGSIFNEGNDGDTEGIDISYGSAAIDRGGAGTLTATAT